MTGFSIQAPDNTQNLNRYTYCLNNPLRFVDPTGESVRTTTDPDGITSSRIYNPLGMFVEVNDAVETYIISRYRDRKLVSPRR